MDVDTEPPMDGPGEGPQLYCKPIGVDADDASDGDAADVSDAGEVAAGRRTLWKGAAHMSANMCASSSRRSETRRLRRAP